MCVYGDLILMTDRICSAVRTNSMKSSENGANKQTMTMHHSQLPNVFRSHLNCS